MRTSLLALLLVFVTITTAVAAPPIPGRDEAYPANTWIWWEVTAPDAEVRSSSQLDALLKTPRSRWTRVDPSRWAATGMLPRGYVARARVVDGSTIIKDAAGHGWLVVDLGQGRTAVTPATGRALWASDAEPVKAQANGDYRRTPHVFWQVIDPDPHGLNARQHPRFPRQYDAADAVWPDGPVVDWPVVGAIPRGTVLEAVRGNVGVVHQRDDNGSVWLLVHYGQDLVFVRWNKRFVVPVAGPVRPVRPRRG
ncbi:MAG: hypothetical protein EB084_18720 [Proteobacteria bacterium]|nr:hypothetical protein [Pseudomonadota bacterium]